MPASSNQEKFVRAIASLWNRERLMLSQSAADPESLAHYLTAFKRMHPQTLASLKTTPSGLHYLEAVFSYSRFLSEEVIQHPDWIESLAHCSSMHRQLSAEELQSSFRAFPEANRYAAFRRRQLLRILIRDVLGYGTLSGITEELSDLADCILHFAYQEIRRQLAGRFGAPRYLNRDRVDEDCAFSVIALGKLGGRELNFSSDIDLMFVYAGNGVTDGVESISNKEFFHKSRTCIPASSLPIRRAAVYRVDLNCARMVMRLFVA
ncbi:MAG: hypothetical protein WKF37_13410 [Bryobacteraceae bacterium]